MLLSAMGKAVDNTDVVYYIVTVNSYTTLYMYALHT